VPLLVISKLKAVDFCSKVEVPYNLRNKYPVVFGLLDSGREIEMSLFLPAGTLLRT